MKEKGYTAEEYTFPVRIALGRMENILRTVTFCGVLSFYGFLDVLSFAVNVGFSPRFTVFSYKSKEKRKEKRK